MMATTPFIIHASSSKSDANLFLKKLFLTGIMVCIVHSSHGQLAIGTKDVSGRAFFTDAGGLITGKVTLTAELDLGGHPITNAIIYGNGAGVTNLSAGSYTETDPIWTAQKSQYATGTPVYVETDPTIVAGYPLPAMDGGALTNLPQPTATNFVAKTGDTMSGKLTTPNLMVGVYNVATQTYTFAAGFSNRAFAAYSTIAGGNQNLIAKDASGSFIGGGVLNTIPNASRQVIGGGVNNSINTAANLNDNAILSGNNNSIAGSYESIICGGYMNSLSGAARTFIGGGAYNYVYGDISTLAGGAFNRVRGNYHAILGGWNNVITNLTGYSAILGGQGNMCISNAAYAAILGGASNNVFSPYGLAWGIKAISQHTNAWVFSDGTIPNFSSSTNHQFIIGIVNGMAVGTNVTYPGSLNVAGSIYATKYTPVITNIPNLNEYQTNSVFRRQISITAELTPAASDAAEVALVVNGVDETSLAVPAMTAGPFVMQMTAFADAEAIYYITNRSSGTASVSIRSFRATPQ
jgi:hypothetical protein